MKFKFYVILFTAVMLCACGGEKKNSPVFYDSDIDSSMDYTTYDDDTSSDYDYIGHNEIVSIPFRERYGVKYVNVSVNGFGFEMIFDTGCSGTLISVAEANYLYQKGYLSDDDILGITHSQIADGSIVENMVINLKEVILDDKIKCTDVTATVSANNNAPLLLGNEVLNRVASYVVDNENQTINFKLR